MEPIADILARLETERVRAGLTPSELSTASGIPLDRLAAIESGDVEPSITEFVELAWAIGVSPAALIDVPSPAG